MSEAIAALFGTHGQTIPNPHRSAAAFHDNFVNLLNGGAAQYLSAEVANRSKRYRASGAGGAAAGTPTETPQRSRQR